MPAPISLPERVALLWSESGSQRAVARLLGVSHQRVGRLLRTALGMGRAEGGYDAGSRALAAPDLIAGVAQAFPAYVARARERARRDRLPFTGDAPIYAERLPMQRKIRRTEVDPDTGMLTVAMEPQFLPDGSPDMIPGLRIQAKNLHWIPEHLRNRWLQYQRKSDRFVNVSVSSLLNLALYQKQADERFNAEKKRKPGLLRTDAQKRARAWIAKTLREGGPTESHERVFGKYVAMRPGTLPESFVRALDYEIKRKHEPAADHPADLANLILLQAGRNDPVSRERTDGKRKKRARSGSKGAGKGSKGAGKAGRRRR